MHSIYSLHDDAAVNLHRPAWERLKTAYATAQGRELEGKDLVSLIEFLARLGADVVATNLLAEPESNDPGVYSDFRTFQEVRVALGASASNELSAWLSVLDRSTLNRLLARATRAIHDGDEVVAGF